MARPEKNTVEYFPFLCEEGKKMFYLEETYGNDGFAVFVKLLRELARTNYHYLDLSKKTTLMFLSAKCKVSKDTMEAIINDLVDLEKFNEDLWVNNKVIWCQDFIDSIQDAYNKRKNECITLEGLLQHLIRLGVRKPIKQPSELHDKTQTILYNNKPKKTKEDDEKPVDDKNSLITIERCKEKYLADEKIKKAVSGNKENKIEYSEIEGRIELFNAHLTESGDMVKSFQDYCKHFRDWHKKNRKANVKSKRPQYL